LDYSGSKSIAQASAMVFMTGFLSVFPVPIERAILSNVTLPESRGRANSLLNIIDDLGKGLGPFLLSVLISSLGRKTSFNLSLIGWLVGGTIFFLCGVHYKMMNSRSKRLSNRI
jgi:MFS family permease